MVRVLHIVTHMNRGGLETMIMNYYRQVDRNQLQFDFLVHRQEEAAYDEEIRQMGGRIYHIRKLNPLSRSYWWELNHFFEKHPEYKIVHSHLDCMSSVPLKAAMLHGVPVRIAHSHSSNQDRDVKYLIKNIYKRNIKKYATKLFACSLNAGEWMFCTHDFEVLPNAIDVKKFSFDQDIRNWIRSALQIEDKFALVHVGRFSKVKNHEFLINIFCELLKILPESRLILVGSGGERFLEIKEKIHRLGLDEFVLLVGIRTDVNEILQGMDAFVLPSLYEGLPVSVIEAQSSGLMTFISDKVPIECKKTELVRQISLHDTPSKWAFEIKKAKGASRNNTYESMVRSGFDIVENARRLEHFYLTSK